MLLNPDKWDSSFYFFLKSFYFQDIFGYLKFYIMGRANCKNISGIGFEKLIINIITFSMVINYCFAQEHYHPGYVVNNNGDTVSGFINYQNWNINPDKIFFKERDTTTEIVFTPLDIQSFFVADEYYVSATVTIDTAARKLNDLSYSSLPETKTGTVFLLSLIRGSKSLYFLKSALYNENFYILNDNNEFELLVYVRYFMDIDRRSKTVVLENETYKGRLILYLSDCPNILKKANVVNYSAVSLLNLFSYYYECSDKEIKYIKKSDKIKISTGVITGIAQTKLQFSGDLHEDLVNADFPASTDFTLGLNLEIILLRSLGKWSLYNELQYMGYKVEWEYMDFHNENYYTETLNKLGFGYIKLNNLIRYKFFSKKFDLFLNGGLSNGLIISSTNYQLKKELFYSVYKETGGLVLKDLKNIETAFCFGTGCMYKRFSGEVRFEYGNGISPFSDLGSSTTKWYFLLGYRF